MSTGRVSGTASVTTPRIPVQLSTVACRQPSGRARSRPTLRAIPRMASDPKIQTKRATVTVITTAAITMVHDSGIASIPPIRSIAPRSEKPIRMKTSASRTNTMMNHAELARRRTSADKISC